MHASPSYGRPSLMPLAVAALAAISLAGYATVATGAPVTGASPVQQAREAADEVWEEGGQTVKEETLAHRPEREQAKLEQQEESLEAASQPEAAGTGEAAEAGETAGSGEAAEAGETAGSGETGETAGPGEAGERSEAIPASGG